MKPADRKAFIGAVGDELVKKHGKLKHYHVDDIRRAATSRGYSDDIVCWAFCIFASPGDFKILHDGLGEVCDYTAMKAEVLTDLAGGSFEWADLDLSWLEWPDIDLSGIFDWF